MENEPKLTQPIRVATEGEQPTFYSSFEDAFRTGILRNPSKRHTLSRPMGIPIQVTLDMHAGCIFELISIQSGDKQGCVTVKDGSDVWKESDGKTYYDFVFLTDQPKEVIEKGVIRIKLVDPREAVAEFSVPPSDSLTLEKLMKSYAAAEATMQSKLTQILNGGYPQEQ